MTEADKPLALRARDATGMSQRQFAAHFGLSLATLRKWEQGERSPTGAARVLLSLIEVNPTHMAGFVGRLTRRRG